MSGGGEPGGEADIPAVQTVQRTLGLERDSAEEWDEDYEISRRFLATSVGFVALGLPVLMLLFSIGGCFRDSISHYYYGGISGTLFTGLLFFIGAFLLAYRSVKWVTRLTTVAGVLAFAVAIFPTDDTGCENGTLTARPFLQLTTDAEGDVTNETKENLELYFSLPGAPKRLHFLAAATLFAILAVFCFFVFTRVLPKHRKLDLSLRPEKARRDRIYRLCGVAIIVSMAAIASKGIFGDSWTALNLTFWFEALALWAFGLSWVLKGRLGWFKHTAPGRLLLDPEDRKTLDDSPVARD